MNELAKDLRIGNYTLFMGRIDIMSDGYDLDHVKGDEFGCHEPMPITNDVLDDLGFVRDGDIFRFNDSSLTVRKHGGSYLVELFSTTIKSVEHVHKLQNIFYEIKDKELKFKKTK